jgi:hypothetical protein
VVYHIQYPGRLNGAGGPDYCGVVLHQGQRALRGDVELHVRSSDWRRHGHESDHRYDSVVLHVVLEDDCSGGTTLASGVRVPIAVARCQPPAGPGHPLPCAGCYAADPRKVSEVLASEGMLRLQVKSRRSADLVERVGPEQALLCLIARTLGYSSNAVQCEDVADRLGLRATRAALGMLPSLERQALVLGLAGLLPSQRNRGAGAGVDDCRLHEAAWRGMGLENMSMPSAEWNLGRIYPNNHPVRRLVGLADLLPRLPCIVEELSRSVACGSLDCRLLRELERRVRVEGDDYWRRHFDFGRATPSSEVVGQGKAREIIVNAIIPLALAMASADILNLAPFNEAFRAYPATGQNAVTRHMRAQLGVSMSSVPAVQAQGMLQLFHTYCTRGLCAECPLGGCPTAS